MKTYKLYYAMNPIDRSKPQFKVGCTSRDLYQRCFKEQTYRQYGVIEECFSVEQAERREDYWQEYYDCKDNTCPLTKTLANQRRMAVASHTKDAWKKRRATQKVSLSWKLNNIEAKKKPILQLDLYGNLIKEWPSVTDAARELSIGNSAITATIRGTQKTGAGFVWKHANPLDGHLS